MHSYDMFIIFTFIHLIILLFRLRKWGFHLWPLSPYNQPQETPTEQIVQMSEEMHEKVKLMIAINKKNNKEIQQI